jgi:hypothetical protein
MDDTSSTIVSVLRVRTLTTKTLHAAPVPVIYVDASLSDGSAMLLFRTRTDAVMLHDSDLIGLTPRQAQDLATERGVLL